MFLCRTPLVTPRISSGWAARRAACCGIFVARCDRFFDFAQIGTNARAARFVNGKAALILAGAFFGLWGVCHDAVVFRFGQVIGFNWNKHAGIDPTPGFVYRVILAWAGLTRMYDGGV